MAGTTDDTNYVPFNRDEFAAKAATTRKATYSRSAYEHDRRIVNAALKNISVSKDDLEYCSKLYPTYAIEVLLLSRTRFWSVGVNIDKYLEAVLTDWLRDRVDDPEAYAKDLFEAIAAKECMDGTFEVEFECYCRSGRRRD